MAAAQFNDKSAKSSRVHSKKNRRSIVYREYGFLIKLRKEMKIMKLVLITHIFAVIIEYNKCFENIIY